MKILRFVLILVAVLQLGLFSASAQDIIVLNNANADEIEAKIQEVTQTEVKYKKWSYQDGPTFTIATKDIFVVKYQNGEKQRFNMMEQEQPYQQSVAESQSARSYAEYVPTKTKSVAQNSISSASRAKQPSTITKDSNTGFNGYTTLSYVHGLDGDWWFASPTVTLGYRFNSNWFVGGTSGVYCNEWTSIIPIMATLRFDSAIGRNTTFCGEVSLGGGIVADGGDGSGFLATIGPGVSLGGFGLGISYFTTGEGSGGIALRFGFDF